MPEVSIFNRRSAVRVWKFETAFLGKGLSQNPKGIRTRRQFDDGNREETEGANETSERPAGVAEIRKKREREKAREKKRDRER